MSASVTATAAASLSWDDALGCDFEKEIPDSPNPGKVFPTAKVVIAGVPIWMTPELVAVMHGSAGADGPISLGLNGGLTVTGGVTYHQGFHPTLSATPTVTASMQAGPTGNASLEFALGAKLYFDFYSIRLFTCEVLDECEEAPATPYAELTDNTELKFQTVDPWWRLDGGLHFAIGLDFPEIHLNAETDFPLARTSLLGPPGTPTNLTATPGDSSAAISWQAPPADPATPPQEPCTRCLKVTGYTVYLDGKQAATTDATTTSTTLNGLTNGTHYQVTVKATSTFGISSKQTAPITVIPGVLDHLVLSPASASIQAGASQTYTVEGYDAADDDLGPDPNATLTISPDGSCAHYTCTPATSGDHTVTATDGTATGNADLKVGSQSQVSFTRAWGWGVADGQSQFETCTTLTGCQGGISGWGAGQFDDPTGVAVDGSGDVFVSDRGANQVDEFSSSGAFTKTWGWGVLDSQEQFETCTTLTGCQGGIGSFGAGQLDAPLGIAVDGSGNVFVADLYNARVDEFSSSGAFIKAWGWGVADGQSQLETCNTTCQYGLWGGGAGQFAEPQGDQRVGIAVDGSGDVFVSDIDNARVDEFSSSGAFIKAWGWGVANGQNQFETCTTLTGCQAGIAGGGAGQFYAPNAVAVDGSGDVFVTDGLGESGNNVYGDERVDEFSSSGAFIKAWGWGVLPGQSGFETCTTLTGCQAGEGTDSTGAFSDPDGVAVDGSGDVFVADNINDRVQEFSSSGAFIKTWGWGVADGQSQLETCTTFCRYGLQGGGAGEFHNPDGVAVDSSGDVFVVEGADPYYGSGNERVDEFSASTP